MTNLGKYPHPTPIAGPELRWSLTRSLRACSTKKSHRARRKADLFCELAPTQWQAVTDLSRQASRQLFRRMLRQDAASYGNGLNVHRAHICSFIFSFFVFFFGSPPVVSWLKFRGSVLVFSRFDELFSFFVCSPSFLVLFFRLVADGRE